MGNGAGRAPEAPDPATTATSTERRHRRAQRGRVPPRPRARAGRAPRLRARLGAPRQRRALSPLRRRAARARRALDRAPAPGRLRLVARSRRSPGRAPRVASRGAGARGDRGRATGAGLAPPGLATLLRSLASCREPRRSPIARPAPAPPSPRALRRRPRPRRRSPPQRHPRAGPRAAGHWPAAPLRPPGAPHPAATVFSAERLFTMSGEAASTTPSATATRSTWRLPGCDARSRISCPAVRWWRRHRRAGGWPPI